ncbi:MAG: ABC transporter permease [Gammaproteobacteria bacterium]
MHVADLSRLLFRAITAHKLRSLLTALGIVVGIFAVVLLTAIGEGIHRYVLQQFTQFGTNLIAVTPGRTSVFGLSGATINSVRPLSLDDAENLRQLDDIVEVVPVVQGNARVEAGEKQRRTQVFGVGAAVPEVWKIKVRLGRFFPRDEDINPRSFAVLGSKLYKELFGDGNPLGQRVRIGSDRFVVIGVMEEKGQMLGLDLDDSIYIPVAKALALFDREGLMEADLLYKAGAAAEQVGNAIKRRLIARHGEEDFTLITQNQMLATLNSVLSVLTMAVGALGGISLLVGSVGIVTIMTIAVSERVSEIGLLRAIGAERGTIFRMFLGEALALSTAGGIGGVALGIAAVQGVKLFLPGLPVQLAWFYIAGALLFSMLIGLAAGVLPAMQAARLNPLEALRTE